jgi:hypothetical protein
MFWARGLRGPAIVRTPILSLLLCVAAASASTLTGVFFAVHSPADPPETNAGERPARRAASLCVIVRSAVTFLVGGVVPTGMVYYYMDFGDGASAQASSAARDVSFEHSYSTAGRFLARLSVTDTNASTPAAFSGVPLLGDGSFPPFVERTVLVVQRLPKSVVVRTPGAAAALRTLPHRTDARAPVRPRRPAELLARGLADGIRAHGGADARGARRGRHNHHRAGARRRATHAPRRRLPAHCQRANHL